MLGTDNNLLVPIEEKINIGQYFEFSKEMDHLKSCSGQADPRWAWSPRMDSSSSHWDTGTGGRALFEQLILLFVLNNFYVSWVQMRHY